MTLNTAHKYRHLDLCKLQIILFSAFYRASNKSGTDANCKCLSSFYLKIKNGIAIGRNDGDVITHFSDTLYITFFLPESSIFFEGQ
jgi:hypothetical protein